MAVVKADFETCQGYANCVMAAPEVYDIDDEGTVVLLKEEITDEERAKVDEAVNSCPVSALSVEDA
ncbi:MAG: ferredoxin [Geodermatophilaceae bacterium]|nr:ferredoxin [Geodermatophilaceae bacterium]MDQ3463553.1 ferredoxin [Actinomycetota bacterium]